MESYILVKWGGYAGDEGPQRTKCFAFRQPTVKEMCKFAGATDAEHLLGLVEEGYLDVLWCHEEKHQAWLQLPLNRVAKLVKGGVR